MVCVVIPTLTDEVGEVEPAVPAAVTQQRLRAVVNLGLLRLKLTYSFSPPFALNIQSGALVPTVGPELSNNLRYAAELLLLLSKRTLEM